MKQMILRLGVIILGLGAAAAQEAPLPVAGVTAIAFSPEGGGQALVSDPANLGQVVAAAVEDGAVVAGELVKSGDIASL